MTAPAAPDTAITSGAVADPLVESPIKFVPGLRAQPDRSPQEEPEGSGPFEF